MSDVEAGETFLAPTPSQTAGPFLSIGTHWNATAATVRPGAGGAVAISGRVVDGAGAPVTDALLEFWQADAEGRFPPATVEGWRGFARSLTDGDGRYRLLTEKPGRLPTADGALEAPHVNVSIFARGLLQRLVTRIYFGDETAANAEDPLLSSIAEPAVAATLVAEPGPDGYELDLRLQGEHETVFFVP